MTTLTTAEFEYFLSLPKCFKENDEIVLGPAPMTWSRDIVGISVNERFILDFNRSGYELKKYSLNKRFRNSIVLLRYCSLKRHTNPSGTDERTFDGPHVHLYREGFDARLAFPISEVGLSGGETMDQVFTKLMSYANVAGVPTIKLSII